MSKFLNLSRGSYVRALHRGKVNTAVLTIGLLLPLPALADPVTLLALGDSLTQGYGLDQGDGLVPQLEAWLNDHGAEVTIINAGVSGDTTAGGLARVDWSLTEEVDAMMVALGGNDLLRGIDPAEVRANLDGILAAGEGRGLPMLLVGLQATGNYGAEYKAEFDALYPELAEAHGALFYPSFFDALAPGGDAAEARGLMQGDGIHPNAEGVARVVDRIGPVVLELVQQAAE